MEMSVLIQRNVIRGMVVAEDVAAAPAMVSTFEEGERFFASG